MSQMEKCYGQVLDAFMLQPLEQKDAAPSHADFDDFEVKAEDEPEGEEDGEEDGVIESFDKF